MFLKKMRNEYKLLRGNIWERILKEEYTHQIIYPIKIKITNSKVFNKGFSVGNTGELRFVLDYSYKGKKHIKEITYNIEVKRK